MISRRTPVAPFPLPGSEEWSYGLSTFVRPRARRQYTWMLPRMRPDRQSRHSRDPRQLADIGISTSRRQSREHHLTTVDNADILGGGDQQGGGVPIVVTGDPILPRGERTLERWFDTSVFARPAAGEIANGRKDVVRLPGVRDTSLTISKLFPVGSGRRSAQFRWEIYNLFNSLQYNAIDRAARFDAQGRQVNTRFGQVLSTATEHAWSLRRPSSASKRNTRGLRAFDIYSACVGMTAARASSEVEMLGSRIHQATTRSAPGRRCGPYVPILSRVKVSRDCSGVSLALE